MLDTIRDLLSSKKFLAMLTAIVVYAAGRLGFDIDAAVLDRIWQALMVYVAAQGIADHGKSAAQVKAAAGQDLGTGTIGGRAASLFALVCVGALLAGAGGALSACTATQRAELKQDAKHAVINCTAQQLGTTPGLDLATLVAIANTVAAERAKCMTPNGLDWQCVERDAIGQGVTVGGCALVQLVAAAASTTRPSSSGLVAGDPAPPPGHVELEQFRAQVTAGATFHTANGDW
jgi:hypothetical protein